MGQTVYKFEVVIYIVIFPYCFFVSELPVCVFYLIINGILIFLTDFKEFFIDQVKLRTFNMYAKDIFPVFKNYIYCLALQIILIFMYFDLAAFPLWFLEFYATFRSFPHLKIMKILTLCLECVFFFSFSIFIPSGICLGVKIGSPALYFSTQ